MTDADPPDPGERQGSAPARPPARIRPAWMAATLREAAACRARLPWERGARRRAFIARRTPEAAPAPAWREAS